MKELTRVELEYVNGGADVTTSDVNFIARIVGGILDTLVPGTTYFTVGFDNVFKGLGMLLNDFSTGFSLINKGIGIIFNPTVNPDVDADADVVAVV